MKYNQKYQQIQREGDIKKLMDHFTDTLNKVLHSRAQLVSYQLAYDNVYKLTKLSKQAQVLSLIDQKLSSFVNSLFDEKQSLPLRFIGETLVLAHSISERISEICLYLDLNYCQKSLNYPLIKRLNKLVFSTLVQNEKAVKSIAKGAFQVRFGNSEQFTSNIELIVKIDQKEEFFQKYLIPHYIPLVKEYYVKLAEEEFLKKPVKNYLQWCRAHLQQEQKYIYEQIGKKKKKHQAIQAVILTLYQTIVSFYKAKIYQNDQKELFENLTLPILQLFKFGKGKEVQGHIQWFMQALQKRLNNIPTNNNEEFIYLFCQLYEYVAALLKNTQSKFQINYRSVFTFQQWINNEKFNLPLRLNILIDEKLSGVKQNFESFVKKVILVFKLVKQKNIFQNMYRRTLINRLVYYYATYNLAEQNRLIEAMQKQCGEQWTLKIKEICSIFIKDRESLLKSKGITLITDESNWSIGGIVPVIVTQNAWPFQQRSSKTVLHRKLLQLTPWFQAHYLSQGKKHKLLWSNKGGSVTLAIKFSKASRLFIVSVDMANLLLYVQNQPKKLGNFVCQQGYALDEVQGFVQLLTNQKLIASNQVGSDLQLTLAQQFQQGSLVDLVRQKKDRKVEVKAMEELKPDRKLMVEAIIVKIMKSEKVCKRAELLQKSEPLVKQRGFNFNSEFVQKSIDRLIDKQFIRDFTDGTLGYIA